MTRQRLAIFVQPTRSGNYRVELCNTDVGKYERVKIRYAKTWMDAMGITTHWSALHGVEAVDRHYTRIPD